MHIREDLPIMPLNSVLFPGAPASLYIEEQRYRRMLANCLAEDGIFGVALLKAGKEVGGSGIPHTVGTLAKIAQVTKLPDDSSIVLARGAQRFRISSISQLSPVVEADVEVLDEQVASGAADSRMLVTARDAMAELLSLMLQALGHKDVEPPIPEDLVALSYAAAVHVQAPLAVQQRLLEAPSAAERLEMAMPMLRKEIGYYRVMLAAQKQRDEMGADDDQGSLFSRN